MKKLICLALAVMLALSAVSAFASADQHVKGTVEWHLDPNRDYEPGTVVVKRYDGEIEETTIIKLMEDYKANPIRFEENYLGDMSLNVMRLSPEYIVIANVGSIEAPTNYSGHNLDYGYIKTETPQSGASLNDFAYFLIEPPTKESIAKLNKGDLIVATGRIWNIFASEIKLYAFNYFVDGVLGYSGTTLEPYNEYMEWASKQK